MISKTQFLIPVIIAINSLGVGLSLLYGKYGGSGGATTEGVFLGVKITGIIVVVIAIVFSIIFKDWFFKNWYFIILIVLAGLLQAFFLDIIR